MAFILDTMDRETATRCGYGDPTHYEDGGLLIGHEVHPSIGHEFVIMQGEQVVEICGDGECRAAVEAMARALGYKLVKIGEK